MAILKATLCLMAFIALLTILFFAMTVPVLRDILGVLSGIIVFGVIWTAAYLHFKNDKHG